MRVLTLGLLLTILSLILSIVRVLRQMNTSSTNTRTYSYNVMYQLSSAIRVVYTQAAPMMAIDLYNPFRSLHVYHLSITAQ